MDDPVNSDSDLDNEDFYFESDHLALRGNPDYTAVLRAIAILQAQKIQAIHDLEKLASAEKSALDNPIEFIEKVVKGGMLDLPGPINIVDLPKINFSKYEVNVPEFINDDPKSSENYDVRVRGRTFDATKPETFNQLWTCEEQIRLEELLIEYPPEPYERKRFAKIARALGTRTTKQVASRVQKFFIKLHSAGMPIPGRVPKSIRTTSNKGHRFKKHGIRPTTFFPANYVPVNIMDDDDLGGEDNNVYLDPNSYVQGSSKGLYGTENDEKPRTVVVNEESENENENEEKVNDRIVKLLHRVRTDMEKDSDQSRPISEHDGYKCEICTLEPIMGTRWHCKTCTDQSIDYCTDCIITQATSDHPHPIDHRIVGFRVLAEPMSPEQSDSESDVQSDDNMSEDNSKVSFKPSTSQYQDAIYDRDYMPNNVNYNYLDPNFLPQ